MLVEALQRNFAHIGIAIVAEEKSKKFRIDLNPVAEQKLGLVEVDRAVLPILKYLLSLFFDRVCS